MFSQGFQIRASRDRGRDSAGELGLRPPDRGARASAARVEARETVEILFYRRRDRARANDEQQQG